MFRIHRCSACDAIVDQGYALRSGRFKVYLCVSCADRYPYPYQLDAFTSMYWGWRPESPEKVKCAVNKLDALVGRRVRVRAKVWVGPRYEDIIEPPSEGIVVARCYASSLSHVKSAYYHVRGINPSDPRKSYEVGGYCLTVLD